jgi:glutamate N-acetyltransferase/amino-acid N-acetyltransferase
MPERSPLAPEKFPSLPDLPGVRLVTARAGYKDWDRADLLLAVFEDGAAVAGLTTTSKCPSPEVEWCRAALAGGRARALVVNAGNSNAFTGSRGQAAVDFILDTVGGELGAPREEVFVASTGVIGVPLPRDKAAAGLKSAFTKLSVGSDASWLHAASTIMTTDTYAKGASATAIVGGESVAVVGIAKGSGMIAPDMATMLAFVFTDAAVEPALLQSMLAEAADRSFHAITVDSDTSTSDTLLAFATGRTGPRIADPNSPDAAALRAALAKVCTDLARQVVRDGEGAQKFITVTVEGAESDASARRVALSIANSPLVKTAIAGEDANWGRVVMAVGKAGEPAERDRLSVRFGDTVVAQDGMVVDGYDEAPVAAHLKGQDIGIGVDLGLGEGRATVWTCDLTHGYISINADYRS